MTKRVLVLASGLPLPPRVLKFVTHLPLSGWHPTILVPKRRETDFGFKSDGSGTRVIETFRIRSTGDAARWLVAKLVHSREPNAANWSERPAERLRRQSSIERLARRLLLWTNVPDEVVGWIPWALRAGMRCIREEGVQVLLATGAPFSVVLAGVLLKRLTGVPLVADFRDAWAQDPIDPNGCIGGHFRAPYGTAWLGVLRFLERYTIRSADAVVFTSDVTLAEYGKAYPEIEKKGLVLYNGAEESDFAVPGDAQAPFTFTYVGTLHDFQAQDVSLFLRACALALASDEAFAACRVGIWGYRPEPMTHYLARLIRGLGLEGLVQLAGPVPHPVAVGKMKSPGVLLLFNGETRFVRMSKVSEYLAARRPILSIGPTDSETATHVLRAGHRAYGGTSPEELKEVLLDLWRAHRRDPWTPYSFPFADPHPLNWRTAARTLGDVMDGLSVKDPPGMESP